MNVIMKQIYSYDVHLMTKKHIEKMAEKIKAETGKPFACGKCSKTFTLRQSLLRHNLVSCKVNKKLISSKTGNIELTEVVKQLATALKSSVDVNKTSVETANKSMNILNRAMRDFKKIDI